MVRQPGDVSAWPRQASDQAGADRIACRHEHYRNVGRCLLGRDDRRSSTRKNYIDLEPNKLVHDLVEALCFGPAIFDGDSAAFDPTQLSQSLRASRYPLAEGSGCTRDEEADSRELRWLRTRRKWPCHRAPDQRDELPPLHSTTSSAATSRPAGTVRPSALAVLRLMAVSNLVGC